MNAMNDMVLSLGAEGFVRVARDTFALLSRGGQWLCAVVFLSYGEARVLDYSSGECVAYDREPARDALRRVGVLV